MRSKFGYGLIVLLVAGVLNSALMKVIPAYSAEERVSMAQAKMQEFGGKLPINPDGNRDGCERELDTDRSEVEQCGAFAVKVGKVVAEAAVGWVVGKGLDWAANKANESSNEGDGSSGENSFERAAKNSGDASAGSVAKEPNPLAVPEEEFDPK
jgi:hypothetical protein